MLITWPEQSSPQIGAADKRQAVAAVVVGSCEQHARHLPLGTDTILGEAVLREAAKKAGAPVYVLPSIPYGFSHHHRKFPGTVSLEQETLKCLVENIFICAHASGFQRLLMLNAHGGNSAALQFALNELGASYGIKAIFARYWDFAADYIASWRESAPGGIGHAGELETSLMLAVRPDLVDTGQLDGYFPAKGKCPWFHPDMFAPNQITMYNDFSLYSPDGNVGEPAYASREKGERLCAYIAGQLAAFLDGFWEENNLV